MTKDEAIEVLREALTRLMQECELDGLREVAGYDCWLPQAKKVLAATVTIEAPTSEAVAWPTFESWLASPITPPANIVEYARMAFEAGRAAQPAADPAPVPAQTGMDVPTYPHPKCDSGCYYACTEAGTIMPPKCVTETAQGIDHAKRAFDGFMLWAGQHLGQGYSLEREDGTFIDPVTRWAFKAWQARGQQAGGAGGGGQ